MPMYEPELRMACTNGQVLVRAGVIERIGSGMVFDNIEEARSALKATGQASAFAGVESR